MGCVPGIEVDLRIDFDVSHIVNVLKKMQL